MCIVRRIRDAGKTAHETPLTAHRDLRLWAVGENMRQQCFHLIRRRCGGIEINQRRTPFAVLEGCGASEAHDCRVCWLNDIRWLRGKGTACGYP